MYGDLGGRFDHSFGIVNSLMIARDYFNDLVLVGPCSTLRVLPSGHYLIERSSKFNNKDGDICGIIPLGGWICEHITTTGLKWNLDDSAMQFGGLVSSSNCMLEDSVTIQTPYPVVWTLSTQWNIYVCLFYHNRSTDRNQSHFSYLCVSCLVIIHQYDYQDVKNTIKKRISSWVFVPLKF